MILIELSTVVTYFCVFQRKHEGFHLGEINNEVEGSTFFKMFCNIKIRKPF